MINTETDETTRTGLPSKDACLLRARIYMFSNKDKPSTCLDFTGIILLLLSSISLSNALIIFVMSVSKIFD